MNRLYFLVPTTILAAMFIPGAAVTTPSELPGDVVTLLSNDDLMCTYSMRHKDVGMVIQDGEVRNRSTDIMFDRYGNDVLAIAVEGGSKGAIIDLGDAKTGDPAVSVFWSLRRDGDQIAWSGGPDASKLPSFSKLPLTGSATAPAVLGHTYVMKWFHSDSKSPSYAALKVIDMSPKRFVTLRWRFLN